MEFDNGTTYCLPFSMPSSLSRDFLDQMHFDKLNSIGNHRQWAHYTLLSTSSQDRTILRGFLNGEAYEPFRGKVTNLPCLAICARPIRIKACFWSHRWWEPRDGCVSCITAALKVSLSSTLGSGIKWTYLQLRNETGFALVRVSAKPFGVARSVDVVPQFAIPSILLFAYIPL